jgi:hypothetical protein
VTKSEKLIVLATALYGVWWHDALAQELGVGREQVDRWVRGEDDPPPDGVKRLLIVALVRLDTISKAIDAIG